MLYHVSIILLTRNIWVHGSVGGVDVTIALHVVNSWRHVWIAKAVNTTLVAVHAVAVLHLHLRGLVLSWEEDVSQQAASDEAQNKNANDDTDEAANWNAGNLVTLTGVLGVQVGVGRLNVDLMSQSVIKLIIWIVSMVAIVWTVSSNTKSSDSLIWRNESGADNIFLSVQLTLLSLESRYLMSDFSLFLSDLVQVLLLDSLLLNSLLLLLELKSDFFSFNFLKFSLNKRVVNLTVLVGFDLLEKSGLLLKLVFASSLSRGIGWDIGLSGVVLSSQFPGQNIKLMLRIEAGVCLGLINTSAVTANESNCTGLSITASSLILSAAAAWVATAKTGSGAKTEAAVVEAFTLQQRGALAAIAGKHTFSGCLDRRLSLLHIDNSFDIDGLSLILLL